MAETQSLMHATATTSINSSESQQHAAAASTFAAVDESEANNSISPSALRLHVARHEEKKRKLLSPLNRLRPSARKPHTRWVVLIVFCCLSASNGFQFIECSAVVDEAKAFFGMTSLEVNFLTTIYTIVYPALIFLGCITFEEFGAYGGMIIGALLNALGAVLRVVAVLWAPSFSMLVVSQVINALSEVFFLSLPPLISATWFDSNQRTLATAIGVMSNALGTAFGFIVPPLVVTKHDGGQGRFLQLFGYHAVAACFVFAATIFMPKQPLHRPSVTAAQSTSLKDLVPSIKFLITHAPFVTLAFASGFSNDTLWTFASFLAQILQPFGVTELEAGWIGFSLTICGSFSSALVGIYVDKYRQYKRLLLAFSFAAAACFSAVTLALLYAPQSAVFGLCFVFISLMGAFLSAAIPLQLEFAVELTYPKPEGVTTAFLLCLSGILTPLLTVGGTEIIGNAPMPPQVINFMIACSALTCASASLQLFVRDVLKRVSIEQTVPVERHDSFDQLDDDAEKDERRKTYEAKKGFPRVESGYLRAETDDILDAAGRGEEPEVL